MPPADEAALAAAIRTAVADPMLAERLGKSSGDRVVNRFTLERQGLSLSAIVEAAFGNPCAETEECLERRER